MINTTLSVDLQEMVAEFHASKKGLDAVTTEYALLHDAIHAYCGLGVSIEEEELVHNIVQVLIGEETLPIYTERANFLVQLLPIEIMIELSNGLAAYY